MISKLTKFMPAVIVSALWAGTIQAAPQPKRVYSFEQKSVPKTWRADEVSTLSLSGRHFKDGRQSLRWDWQAGAILTVTDPEGLAIAQRSRSGGIKAWVYNEKPIDAKLTFRFGTARELRENKPHYQFEFGLNFSGWRAMWVLLAEDAVNKNYKANAPLEVMQIIAPGSHSQGCVSVDLVEFVDEIIWHRTADYQLPNLNAKRGGGSEKYRHLYASRQKASEQPSRQPNAAEKAAFDLITQRIEDWLLGKNLDYANENVLARYKSLLEMFHTADKEYNNLKITRDGRYITGVPLFTFHDSRAGAGLSFRTVHESVLLPLALAYHTPSGPGTDLENPYYRSPQVKERILTLLDYLHDQGWAAGSSVGSRDHGSLYICGYAHTIALCRRQLKEAGTLQRELETLYWYTRFGQVYVELGDLGVNTDDLRTVQLYRLYLILCQESDPEKLQMMRYWMQWSDAGLQIAPGWLDMIKPDYSGYHHKGIYLRGYAQNAFHVSALVAYLLRDTPFERSETVRGNLKNALLTARIMCNKYELPMSIRGRWPFNNRVLSPLFAVQNPVLAELFPAYAYLAMAGDPPDPDLAAAFMRLYDPSEPRIKETMRRCRMSIQFLGSLGATQVINKFARIGFEQESSPNGNWVFPYGGLSIHRRGEWMVSVKGCSKYVWDFETSGATGTRPGQNTLGRYLSHGTVFILGPRSCLRQEDTGVNTADSGYVPHGWDWSRLPGSTAINQTHEMLAETTLGKTKTHRNFTDQVVVGGVSLEGQNGLFAMQLHDTVYNTTFRANKSVFFFDNKIICLGSDIQNDDSERQTETILFQCHLGNNRMRPTWVNSTKGVTKIPFHFQGDKNKPTWLMDSVGNGYFIPNSNELNVARQLQKTEKFGLEGGGSGNFEVAWLNHGRAPKNQGYEYVVLVQSDPNTARAFAANPHYEVWQKDRHAHIVHSKGLDITGYALFEKNLDTKRGIVNSANLPCFVMVGRKANGIVLSVADPDFGWSWKIAKSHRQKSLIANQPSRPRKLRITLNGLWQLQSKPAGTAVVKSTTDKQTVIEFTCIDGKTQEVLLSGPITGSARRMVGKF